MNTTNEIVQYISNALTSAGQQLTYGALNDLLFVIQGYTAALLGEPAIAEVFKVTPDGPRLPSLNVAGNQNSLDPVYASRPVSLEPKVGDIVNAVLRTYASNGFALNEWIKSSPLWRHSEAEGKVHPANSAAFFSKIPALRKMEAHPAVTKWPQTYQPVDEHAIFAQGWAEHNVQAARA